MKVDRSMLHRDNVIKRLSRHMFVNVENPYSGFTTPRIVIIGEIKSNKTQTHITHHTCAVHASLDAIIIMSS